MSISRMSLKAEPIQCIVAIGDSVTYGMSASSPQKCWVSLVTSMLEEIQGEPITLHNQGICSNILSVNSPAYQLSARPSGIERLQRDVIDCHPDLVFFAYGLNDSRGGTSLDIFRRDYQKAIDDIRGQISPLIVTLDLYYMHESFYKGCEGWNESDYEVTETFNAVIREIAEKNGLIFADVYSALKGVDWAVCEDHCHPNDLGHRLIANRVFEAVMRNCKLKE